MRDIVLTLVILGLLPVCFTRPWVGILVWSWIGYMNPHLLTWGFAQQLPFALVVALVTLAGLLASKDRQRIPRDTETVLLVLLWAVFALSTLFAQYPAPARDQLVKVSKMLLMSFATLMVINEPRKLRALLFVIAFSIGFFGLKGGVWALLTGGQFMVLGPPGGSFISSNTGIGLGLNMVLPFLFYLRRDERRPWLRHLLLAMFCFSIVGILVTYSRGALLGLAAVLAVLFLRSRTKIVAVTLLGASLAFGVWFLPQRWHERMETITTYEEEAELSALRRLDSWRVAVGLMTESPLIGAGFRPFSRENYQRLAPARPWPIVDHDAHSIYFQVVAEHGLLGIGLYLAIIVSALLSLQRLIWRSRDPDTVWIRHVALMVQASLIAYLVNGAFFSVSYFDLFYHLVVVTILLKSFARREASDVAPAAARPARRRALIRRSAPWPERSA